MLSFSARQAAGAASIRSSLRPPILRGTRMSHHPDTERAAGTRALVIASVSEAIQNFPRAIVWIASSLTLLAMTAELAVRHLEYCAMDFARRICLLYGRERNAASLAILALSAVLCCQRVRACSTSQSAATTQAPRQTIISRNRRVLPGSSIRVARKRCE